MIFKGVRSIVYQHHLLEVKITAENQEINRGDKNKIVDIDDKRLMTAQYYCPGILYFYFSKCLFFFISVTFV